MDLLFLNECNDLFMVHYKLVPVKSNMFHIDLIGNTLLFTLSFKYIRDITIRKYFLKI